jgi:hypothetical protein
VLVLQSIAPTPKDIRTVKADALAVVKAAVDAVAAPARAKTKSVKFYTITKKTEYSVFFVT